MSVDTHKQLSTLNNLVYITARIDEHLINVVLWSQINDKTSVNSKHTGKKMSFNALETAFYKDGEHCDEKHMISFSTLRSEKLHDEGKYMK